MRNDLVMKGRRPGPNKPTPLPFGGAAPCNAANAITKPAHNAFPDTVKRQGALSQALATPSVSCRLGPLGPSAFRPSRLCPCRT